MGSFRFLPNQIEPRLKITTYIYLPDMLKIKSILALEMVYVTGHDKYYPI